MTATLLAFLAVALCGIAARDQILVAQLSARYGRHLGLLIIATGSTVLTTYIAFWAAQTLQGTVPHRAGLLLAAVALAFATIEMAVKRTSSEKAEPTRSLAAMAIVLVAFQLSDAARFLLFAIAVASHTPEPALYGGILASIAVIGAAWLGGEDLLALPLQGIRRACAIVPALVAAWLVWNVFG